MSQTSEDMDLQEGSVDPLEDWRPPYVAYTTLVGLLDNKLGTNPLPPRIDRGLLDSYAGSVQAMLLATLKTIGFIAEDGRVLEPLKEATQSPALRKKVLRTWAEGFYVEQQRLAEQNATAQMLHESFAKRKITGSTLRKAVVFYLSLVDDTGITKSPHFKPPRQASNSAPRAKKKATAIETPSQPKHDGSAGAGETIVVDLGAAGSVRVSVDVRWLQLPMEVFTRLRAVIGELESLAVTPGVAHTESDVSPTDASAELQ